MGALDGVRIAVATARGRPYFRFTTALRGMGLRFEPLLPRDIPAYGGSVVLTTRGEAPPRAAARMLYEDSLDAPPAVLAGMILRAARGGMEEDGLVIGVDPGRRTGLSVSYRGMEVESSLHTSAESLAGYVAAVLAGLRARRKTVRIGGGDMAAARRIGAMLRRRSRAGFELEFVDERRTSPRARHCNQGGKRDMAAARSISRRAGRPRLAAPPPPAG